MRWLAALMTRVLCAPRSVRPPPATGAPAPATAAAALASAIAVVAQERPLQIAAAHSIGHPTCQLGRAAQELGQRAIVDRRLGIVVQDPGPDPVGEEIADLVAQREQRGQQVGFVLGHQRAGRQRQGPEASRGDLHPEARGHDLLELVGLVEDDHVVLGQDGPAAGQVGPVEVGVDHDHVGRRRGVAGGLGETVIPRGAVERARALPGSDAHHAPGPGTGLEAEVGPVAGPRRLGPGQERADLVDEAFGSALGPVLVRRFEGVGLAPGVNAQFGLDAAVTDLVHPLPADVVAPPLEHGIGEGEPESAVDQRQVLLGQLVLQGLGGGGHHHLLAAEHGGHEVGE